LNAVDAAALLPYLLLGGSILMVMLEISLHRRHAVSFGLTILGLSAAFVSLWIAATAKPQQEAALLLVDGYAVFFIGLSLAAAIAVALFSYGYLERGTGEREEFYLLLLLATLGGCVLVAATHFVSLFLGLELLSVSLYAMIAYVRRRETSVEAGVKYLILAGVSAAFMLFGIALVYAEVGTMDFARLAALPLAGGPANVAVLLGGLALIVVGFGFKLAVVPFHLWTPDVYQGAPAPVSAFVSTVSKGAVFALLLRYFRLVDVHHYASIFILFAVIAVASMLVGNVLALFQTNVKRILAYSSISHLGYLLVGFLASGPLAMLAVAFYLASYFVASLGSFGAVGELSRPERDAEGLADYTGLFWRQPWLASILTLMLLSLAGIPLTTGFVGKFLLVSAGLESSLWWLLLALVAGSVVGLFYYLRVVVTMYLPLEGGPSSAIADQAGLPSFSGGLVLALLGAIAIWLGVYPTPFVQLIQDLVVAGS